VSDRGAIRSSACAALVLDDEEAIQEAVEDRVDVIVS
jgi:hypothetical protein